MNNPQSLDILILGDVIGKPGRHVLSQYLQNLEVKPDLIVANVENVAHGFGVSEKNLEELKAAGVSVFTGGNHTFDRKEIFDFFDKYDCLLRPANYPEGTPGRGWCIINIDGVRIAVINLMGRIFMQPLDSPFTVADRIIAEIKNQADMIIVDMHAEATAEKNAMGQYLDGRVSIVVGSHTHVQTADERILAHGTAYITDMGCCGPYDSIIGMEKEGVFQRMIKQMPTRLSVAAGPSMVNGVRIVIDCSSFKALSIQRVHYRESLDILNI